MFSRIAARFTRFMLNKSNLSIEDRNLLTTCVLDKLAALPLHDMITTNEEGNLLVSGRTLTVDAAGKLRVSAQMALDSYALGLIREQVRYTAITKALHEAQTPEQLMFGKASIWCMSQIDMWLKALAGKVENERELDP